MVSRMRGQLELQLILTYANRNDIDYARMEDTYSPTLHRIDQAIRWRAAHPIDPIPPPPPILTKYSRPPEDLLEQAEPKLARLIAAADVKEGSFVHLLPSRLTQPNQTGSTSTIPIFHVSPSHTIPARIKYIFHLLIFLVPVPPRAKGRRGRKAANTATPLSGLDVSKLLSLAVRDKPSESQLTTTPPIDTTSGASTPDAIIPNVPPSTTTPPLASSILIDPKTRSSTSPAPSNSAQTRTASKPPRRNLAL